MIFRIQAINFIENSGDFQDALPLVRVQIFIGFRLLVFQVGDVSYETAFFLVGAFFHEKEFWLFGDIFINFLEGHKI